MSGTLLLVDDDRAHRQIVRRVIERSNTQLRVVEAESLAQAAERLNQCESVKIIVTDLRLRDGLGTNLLSQIRSGAFIGCKERLPVIILSTSPLEADRHLCLELGADHYLVKNEDPQRFSEEIVEALHRFLI